MINKFLKISGITLGLLAVLNITGCATIMSGGPTKVNVTSTQPGLNVIVTGINNGEKSEKTTPFTVELNKNSDYRFDFRAGENKEESIIIKRELNPWVLGNIYVPTLVLLGGAAVTANTRVGSDIILGGLALIVAGIFGGTFYDIFSNNAQKHDKDNINIILTDPVL